ncbi:MAG TPA: NADH-quinone oxidoreductase subunit A [bacterium]|nr:NADH-quinone oxidoreductase subunit A [bacterium]
MDSGGVALLFLFLLAAATGAGLVALSAAIGRRRPPPERLLPYECGLGPVGEPRHRLPVKFFLTAVLFIIFEVEIAFFYPWALAFRERAQSGEGIVLVVELALFMGFISIALLYAWGSGALEWEK